MCGSMLRITTRDALVRRLEVIVNERQRERLVFVENRIQNLLVAFYQAFPEIGIDYVAGQQQDVNLRAQRRPDLDQPPMVGREVDEFVKAQVELGGLRLGDAV